MHPERATLALIACLLLAAGCLHPSAPNPTNADYGPGFRVSALDVNGLPRPYLLCREPLDRDDDQGRPVAGAAATRCNFEMTPDAGRAGNEVSIAVNPTDPRNVVGAAKDYYPPDAGDCVWDGIYVTHDGAATAYQDRSLDGSPWRQRTNPDPSKVNYATQFWCTTDPVVYFDASGTFYYLAMAYQADPVTGSKLGKDVVPATPLGQGALNDWAFNRATQIVAVSHDGGTTFTTFQSLFEGSYPVAFNDKGWIAASDNGDIHVGWSMSPEGNVYFRSTDGGRTFAGPKILSDVAGTGMGGAAAGYGTYLEVGPGPEVYMAWGTYDAQGLPAAGFTRSLDHGATWESSRYAFSFTPFRVDNALSPRDRRGVYQWPVMATDHAKDSPFAGAVYFVYPDGTRDGSDIWFRASFDQGRTWMPPVRVNDDAPGAFQFLPGISVSAGGVIDVTWMDQRLDKDRYRIDQYYAYSLDGGATWSENLRVRDAPDLGWDPALCKHQNGMVFLGDYLGIASSFQAAHPVWPDSRSGTVCDVYTATVLRPMFAAGYDRAKREAADAFIAAHPVS